MSTTPNRNYRIPDPDVAIHPAVRDALLDIDADVDSISGGVAAALADPGANGIVVRTSLAVTTARTLANAAAGLTWTNGDGVAGNPTPVFANDLAAVEGLATTGVVKRTGTDTWSAGALVAGDIPDLSGTYQPLDADLTAIAALAGTSGLLKKTAANTWALDTATYLTANQTITLSGDVSGSGTTAITTTIGAGVVTNAMLAGSIAASKLIGTDIATVGTLTAGATGAGFTVALDTSTITGTLADARLSANVALRNASNAFAGHQTPSVTDTYDLGSSTLLWRKGWLSELDAVLFAQNTISVIGGWLIVTKDEGTVEEDVDTTETQIDFGTNNIVANDFIIFRSGGAVEYMQATSLVSGNVWNVTRNVDGSGANAWPQGSVWVNFGYNGTGRIELNANSTPRISMMRQGTTYNSQTELLRAGDLNGWGDYAAELYGFATGDPSGVNITIDATNGLRIRHGTTNKIVLTSAGDASFTGSITAAAGSIGGFDIGSDYLRDAANSFGLASTVTGGDDVRFWAGDTFANRATAPFRLTEAGALTATNVNITAGAGAVTLDAAGITIASGLAAANKLKWPGTYTSKADAYLANDASNLAEWAFDLYHSSATGAANITFIASNLGLTDWATLSVVGDGAASQAFVRIRGGSSFNGLIINGGNTDAPAAMLDVRGTQITDTNDAVTNVFSDILNLRHNSSGTPAVNFGGSLLFQLESSTTSNRNAARIGTLWTTATDASRTSAFVIQTVNNAGALAEVVRFAGNGDVTFTGTGNMNADIVSTGANTFARLHLTARTGSADKKWIVSAQGGADSPNNRLAFFDPGIVERVTFYDGGGVAVGAPTGGDKGAGTINAVAVYDDNVLLTDWVFDLHYDGAPKAGDKFYRNGSLYTLKKTRAITQDERRLPWMPLRSEFEQERNLGGMVSRLWQGQEQQQIYIMQLKDEIETLRAAVIR